MRLAAHGLHRSDSALGAFLRRKKAQLGAPKAITATAHKLTKLIYSMLRYGQDYVDAGADYYESQYQQRALRAAKRRAAQLGYQLVPMSDGSRTQHAGASWHANCRVSTQLVGSPADGILAITGDETADACGIVSY